MRENYVQISVTLPPALVQKLRALSQVNSRTLSGTLRVVLRQYVANQESKHGEIDVSSVLLQTPWPVTGIRQPPEYTDG